jgi:hypothetical protein
MTSDAGDPFFPAFICGEHLAIQTLRVIITILVVSFDENGLLDILVSLVRQGVLLPVSPSLWAH